MGNKITFILGGVKSGKTTYALNEAKKLNCPVTYIATAVITDKEIEKRVRDHIKTRPARWKTIEEETNLIKTTNKIGTKTVIVDCINFWVSNNLFEKKHENDILAQTEQFCAILKERRLNCYIISNEVGLSLISQYKMGRNFQSVLGKVNQIIAQNADEVKLMIAGIPLKIK